MEENKVLMTAGVKGLVEEGKLNGENLAIMVREALSFHGKSYFCVFNYQDGKTVLTDGNDNELASYDFEINDRIWVITDDYGDYLVTTALLPSEY